MEDYYRILGINRTASAAEIKKAYHRLARKYHPDSGTGDEGSFRKISEAYETLEDSGKRREYDRKLAAAADAAAAGASRTYGTYGSRQDSSPRGYGTYGGRQDGGPRAYGTYDGRQDGSSRADGTYDGRQDGSSHARGARDDADDMDSAWKIWNDVFGDEEEESAYESSYSGYGRSRGSSGYGSDGYGGAGSSYDRNGRRRSSVDAEDLWEDTYGGYAGDGEDDIMSSFYRFFHTVNDPFDFFGTKRSGKRYSSDADTESSGRRRASGNSYAGSDSGRSAFRSGNASSRQKASASGENASSRRKTSAGGGKCFLAAEGIGRTGDGFRTPWAGSACHRPDHGRGGSPRLHQEDQCPLQGFPERKRVPEVPGLEVFSCCYTGGDFRRQQDPSEGCREAVGSRWFWQCDRDSTGGVKRRSGCAGML